MFDLPPEAIRKITENEMQKQLTEMWFSTKKVSKYPKENWVNSIMECADKQDISSICYIRKSDIDDKMHHYLLLSTDYDEIKELKENNYKDFDEWLKWNIHQDRGMVLLKKVVIDITDVNRHNYFAVNSYICRYLENMGVVKTAFLNEGYPIPDHVTISVADSIWELDQMRANRKVPPYLRERYNQTYKDAVADYAQMYAKKYKDTLTKLPHRNKHEVKINYFKDNHIPLTWVNVSNEFYAYIKEQLKKGRYPEFLYIKDKLPYKVTKNLSKEFEKQNKPGINFWEKDVEKKEYHFGFPSSQEYIFGNLSNEFNTRTLESKWSLSELKEQVPPGQSLQTLYIHQYDLANWNRLCLANNVPWSLNDGSIENLKFTSYNSLEQIPIVYSTQHIDMVNAIVNRLSSEIRDYVPISEKSKNEKLQRDLERIHNLNFNTKKTTDKGMDL